MRFRGFRIDIVGVVFELFLNLNEYFVRWSLFGKVEGVRMVIVVGKSDGDICLYV